MSNVSIWHIFLRLTVFYGASGFVRTSVSSPYFTRVVCSVAAASNSYAEAGMRQICAIACGRVM